MWPIGDQCCWTGYGFWPLCPKRYIISCESVNRVLPRVLPARSIWTFFYLYSNYKKEMTITWICFCVRSVLFPKQGNRIKVVVPNSICILGIFCLKQGQGFKPSPAQLYSNTGRVPPRDSSLSSFCILFYYTNSPLPGFFFQSPLPRPRHVGPPPALALLILPLLLLYFAHLSFDLHQLIGLSGLWDPVHRASFLFLLPLGATWFDLSIILALHLGAIGGIWLGTSNFSALWEPPHGHFKDSDG